MKNTGKKVLLGVAVVVVSLVLYWSLNYATGFKANGVPISIACYFFGMSLYRAIDKRVSYKA